MVSSAGDSQSGFKTIPNYGATMKLVERLTLYALFVDGFEKRLNVLIDNAFVETDFHAGYNPCGRLLFGTER